jgi:hypothetical protein
MHKKVAYNAIDDRRTTRGACVLTLAYKNVLFHNLAPANFRSGKKSSLVIFNIPGWSSLLELLEDTHLHAGRITILVVSYLVEGLECDSKLGNPQLETAKAHP